MNPSFSSLLVAGLLLAAVWLGLRIRRFLPEHHLNAETRDTVKLAMGLVATMTALVLGLLVSSAKSSYDTTRAEVIQIAAKVAFLDRLLAIYGPEAATPRGVFREAVDQAVKDMWSTEASAAGRVPLHRAAGDSVYAAIESLLPRTDLERSLKTQATSLTLEIAQLRTLLLAQSVPSISKPLLIVVIAWLGVIFLSFSLLAPPNATATVSLTVAALSVSGAILLILEMDQPMSGLMQISKEPMLHALKQLAM